MPELHGQVLHFGAMALISADCWVKAMPAACKHDVWSSQQHAERCMSMIAATAIQLQPCAGLHASSVLAWLWPQAPFSDHERLRSPNRNEDLGKTTASLKDIYASAYNRVGE